MSSICWRKRGADRQKAEEKHPEFMPKYKDKHHLHSQETRIEISSQGQDKDRTHS